MGLLNSFGRLQKISYPQFSSGPFLDYIGSILNTDSFQALALRTTVEASDLVLHLSSTNDIHEVIQSLDILSYNICSVLDVANCFQHLSIARQDRKIYALEYMKLMKLVDKLNADQKIFTRLSKALNTDTLDSEAIQVGQSFKRDFEQAGLLLRGESKRRFNTGREMINLGRRMLRNMGANVSSRWKSMIHLQNGRHLVAEQLGYASYSHMILSDSLFGAPDKAFAFLKEFQMNFEHQPPLRIKSSITLSEAISELRKISKDYFGFQTTFGKVCNMPTLEFTDEGSKEICGSILLDLHARSEKPPGPMHFTLRTWNKSSYPDTPPIVLISTAFRNYGCLTSDQVLSLFHEFGHALHAICSATKYHHLSGTRSPLEIAELSSALLERMCIQRGFAPFPTKGEIEEQLVRSHFDLYLHSAQENDCSKEGWLLKLKKDLGVHRSLGYLENLSSRFNHFESYGSSYYVYLLTMDIANDIWNEWTASSDNIDVGLRIRKEILQPGGHLDLASLRQNLVKS